MYVVWNWYWFHKNEISRGYYQEPGIFCQINVFESWILWILFKVVNIPFNLCVITICDFERRGYEVTVTHSFMMTSLYGNIFRVTGLLCREYTRAGDAEHWRFLWVSPEQTIEETIETPVIWDAITLISLWRHCNVWRRQKQTMKDETVKSVFIKTCKDLSFLKNDHFKRKFDTEYSEGNLWLMITLRRVFILSPGWK